MTLEEFINKNRELIKKHIRKELKGWQSLSQEDIELWIANDQFLYNAALESGVSAEDI